MKTTNTNTDALNILSAAQITPATPAASVEAMATFSDFMIGLDDLPTLSRMAMMCIVNGLYAEAGFSDYDTSDLAQDLQVSKGSIGGIMNKLESVDMAFAADYDNGCGDVYCMIYAETVHTYEAEANGGWDLIRAYCKDNAK